VAVALAVWRRRERARWAFTAIVLVFAYTTITNIIERPEGIKIASFFIATIVATSFASRALRSTELRTSHVGLDDTAEAFVDELAAQGPVQVIANHRDRGDVEEYEREGRAKRENHHLPPDTPVVFFEVSVQDASTFSGALRVKGVSIGGHRVLRAESPAVPNTIAAFLLHLRQRTGDPPRVLRLDRGQSPALSPQVRRLRPGRHRAGHPRGAAPGRARPHQASRGAHRGVNASFGHAPAGALMDLCPIDRGDRIA
jgi:hypothetical protein